MTLRLFHCLLFIAIPIISFAQLDTSKIGFRDRPNLWTESNIYRSPLIIKSQNLSPSVIGMQIYPLDSSRAPFCIGGRRFLGVNQSGEPNDVFRIGYNVGATGQYQYGEPSIGISFESRFEQNGINLFEFHLEGNTPNGRGWRTEHTNINRETGNGMSKNFNYDEVNFARGDGSNAQYISFAYPSFRLNGSAYLQHNSNNSDFIYQLNSTGYHLVPLIKLNSEDYIRIGQALNSPADPKGISLQAKNAHLNIDGINAIYGINTAPIAGDSTLQINGSVSVRNGIRIAPMWGAVDSNSVPTKSYVDVRINESANSTISVISDSLNLNPRSANFIRDTLDANTRGYLRSTDLSSLGYLTESVYLNRIRDSLDLNSRLYVTRSEMSDTLNAIARINPYYTQVSISDSLNSNPRPANFIRDSLDANTRGYLRSADLGGLGVVTQTALENRIKDTLDVNTRGYLRSADLGGLGVVTHTALESRIKDTLDANMRGYLRTEDLVVGAYVTETALTTKLKDTLDVNSRGFVRAVEIPSFGYITEMSAESRIKDSLDANHRAYLRSQDIGTFGFITDNETNVRIKDSLDANSRGYVNRSEMQSFAYATEANVGIRIRDTLDANARNFMTRNELSDSLDANSRRHNEFVSKSELGDSLDANKRLVIRPPIAILNAVIDWSTAEVFTDTLITNTVYSFANEINGKTIVVAITNTQGNYSVTWPSYVRWPSGRPPYQSSGNSTDIYTFIKINSVIYGTVVPNY